MKMGHSGPTHPESNTKTIRYTKDTPLINFDYVVNAQWSFTSDPANQDTSPTPNLNHTPSRPQRVPLGPLSRKSNKRAFTLDHT